MREGLLRGGENRRNSKRWMLWPCLGGAMVLYGLKRRSFVGGMITLAGARLIIWGVSDRIFAKPTGQTFSATADTHTVVADPEPLRICGSITIGQPPEDVYYFVRDIENFPRFLDHVKNVRADDAIHSVWTVESPAGVALECDVEVINDMPDKLIAWRTVGCPIAGTGTIRMDTAPGGRGTIVRLALEYKYVPHLPATAPSGMWGIVLS